MSAAPSNAAQFDFIIVGSGAGGAPLAARLAQAGKRVLVIEAGPNQAATRATEPAHEVSRVPGLHGVSTEHPDLSWAFFVDHYSRTQNGRLPDGIPEDPKWHHPNPSQGQDASHEGIFYPRATGVGGCTIHNAMITIAGPDSDWDELAEFLGDESWSGARMRHYFQKLEFNGYIKAPRPATRRSKIGAAWRFTVDSFRWLFGFPPDPTGGRHGFGGWLGTSVTDVSLGLEDRQLVGMLKAALLQAKVEGLDRAWTLVRRFLKGQISQTLDPNHRVTQTTSPEGVVLIPLSVYGRNTTIHQDSSAPFEMRGRRSSPRELLLATLASCPQNLSIWTDCLVTKVLLNKDNPPRATGVEFQRGAQLYRAHTQPASASPATETVEVVPGGEVILCGGAFNTPQLLMLSGIGNPDELKSWSEITFRVRSPGVGRNLQDRYEVSVVSEMRREFSLLDRATYRLPNPQSQPDPHLREWRESGTGIYSSNGSVLGIFKRSRPELAQPDLFIFGIPAEFRGYEVGYSQFDQCKKLFTWVILKSHTGNRDGRITLRNGDPRSTPKINFHYFNEVSRPGQTANDPDVLGLVEGVKFVRGIYHKARRHVASEIRPGFDLVPDGGIEQMKRWIRQDAWGHHACGTCRMGPDGDASAVLDTRFRVRGVEGLRVVDASIFPKIPGYFIVANIYMASEKAADVILEDGKQRAPDSPVYPRELRDLEVETLAERRHAVATAAEPYVPVTTAGEAWAGDVVGLALSGGGIRSATFCLGVLQTLARQHLLRRIDFLSTVSGGGYIGSCLGRLYDRLRRDPTLPGPVAPAGIHPTERVEAELSDSRSRTIEWLRKHGNYIAPRGGGDGRQNVAVFVRNLLSVHFVIGAVLFTAFGFAVALRYGLFDRAFAVSRLAFNKDNLPISHLIASWIGPFFSPWFVLVEFMLLFLVVPRIIGYWLANEDEHGSFKKIPLALLFVSVAGLLIVTVQLRVAEPFILALALLTSLISVELAWRWGRKREEALGSGSLETQRQRTRNYLTYDLGLALALTGGALAFASIDSLAHGLQEWKFQNNVTYAKVFATFGALFMTVMPAARMLLMALLNRKGDSTSTIAQLLFRGMALGVLAVVLFVIPLLFYAFAAHAVFRGGGWYAGIAATLFGAVVTVLLAFPDALTFVNRSSLAATYAARLCRAYLGASNPLRHRPDGANITEVIPGDDIPTIRDYRPHGAGGPLHLINVSLNQTVDRESMQRMRDRQGENLAVSSVAMSIGTVWHSKWADSSSAPSSLARKVPARLEPLGHPPGIPHPLVDQCGEPADRAEQLSLRQWMGISGGAIDAGRGSSTNRGTALLMGLVNLRTGHWWDSGIAHAERLGFPDISILRRLLYLVPRFLATQSLILFEWLANFPGPWSRYWHLSDGGFFENTGAYELIRRRVPRIIVCDGSADPRYQFESLADLVRKVRIDFGARVTSFTKADFAQHVSDSAVQGVVGTEEEVKPELANDGTLLRPAPKHAALYWITYDNDPARKSVLLYIKATITGDEPTDVRQYQATHPEFPHESTVDQFFDEPQWESYRKLGEHTSAPVFANPNWFWQIPV